MDKFWTIVSIAALGMMAFAIFWLYCVLTSSKTDREKADWFLNKFLRNDKT